MGTDTSTSMSTGPGTRGFNAELRDGRRVRVRLITPADKSGLAAGLARMSPRSRYLRFHRMVERLSDDELRYLTEVDMRNHFAWVAVSLDAEGKATVRATLDFSGTLARPDGQVTVSIHQTRHADTDHADVVGRSAYLGDHRDDRVEQRRAAAGGGLSDFLAGAFA